MLGPERLGSDGLEWTVGGEPGELRSPSSPRRGGRPASIDSASASRPSTSRRSAGWVGCTGRKGRSGRRRDRPRCGHRQPEHRPDLRPSGAPGPVVGRGPRACAGPRRAARQPLRSDRRVRDASRSGGPGRARGAGGRGRDTPTSSSRPSEALTASGIRPLRGLEFRAAGLRVPAQRRLLEREPLPRTRERRTFLRAADPALEREGLGRVPPA